jgi:hypothetical protein
MHLSGRLSLVLVIHLDLGLPYLALAVPYLAVRPTRLGTRPHLGTAREMLGELHPRCLQSRTSLVRVLFEKMPLCRS